MSKIYLLNNQKYEGVENLEVFEIEHLDFEVDLSQVDAFVFTSKNAVYSLEKLNKLWKTIPSYVIAEKTAQILKSQGANVVFTGETSHGNEFAYELIPLLKGKKVVYFRALKVVSNLVNILQENEINVQEVVTYKTSCKQNKTKIHKNSIFIFTSPSSVTCFFNQYSWDDSFKAICIGNTTAKYLPENINYHISSSTNIQECIKLAQKLLF